MKIKKWKFKNLDKNNAVKIANEYNIPFFLAMMLEIRGITSFSDIQNFLGNAPEFTTPFDLPDMDKAVRRIEKAIDEFERIAVFGDYDADGVTATAILYTYFESRGANVIYYIPNREKEGYGISCNAIRKLHEQGINLIVTVDNGISAIEEAELAKELNIDLIITDHHRPQSQLLPAVAIVNPFVSDVDKGSQYLSGAGIAFKLIMALEDEENREYIIENYADLAAIGTVADVVSLTGENRTIVKHGLLQLKHPNRPGIYSLLKEASALERKMSASLLAFTVVPRINAAGRVGSPEEAVKLLICDDTEEAQDLALDICSANNIRKDIENEILLEAFEKIEDNPQWMNDNVLVVDGDGWHPGVLGIVASRIVDKFGKPSIVIGVSEEEAKGSGRSIEGFSLFDALSESSDLLLDFGGHTMAAGVTLKPSDIDKFRKKVNICSATKEIPLHTISIDSKLRPASLTVELPKLLSYLEPFGTDNPEPVFALCGMVLESIVPVGAGKHLRLSLRKDAAVIQCMQFSCTQQEFPYQKGDEVDLAVTLETQIYRSNETLSVFVKDIRFSSLDFDQIISQMQLYKRFNLDDTLLDEEKKELTPDRNFFAKLYRYLKANAPINSDAIVLFKRSGVSDFGKMLVALDVFEEMGLICLKKKYDKYTIDLKDVNGKIVLSASHIIGRLVN